jgi:hypothetical protein
MTKKRIAHKIELWVDDDLDTTFEQIAQIKKIGYPKRSREAVDMTCMESDIADNQPSPVLDVGDVPFTVFWDEADVDHLRLDALVDSGAIVKFKVVFPFADGTITKTFDAWVKEMGETPYEVKNEVMRDGILTLTTKPVTS